MSEGWIQRAEAALETGTVSSDTDKLLRGERPALLDADGIKAVMSPLLAAFFWAAAIFREMVSDSSLDPLGLILRLLALGLTLRVVLLGGTLLKRVSVFLNAPRYGLVLTPDGLLYRTPSHDVAIPKEDIVGIAQHGHWQRREKGTPWREVYVALDPTTHRTHLALPPVFEATPGRLAERLMRWRGAPADPRKLTAKPVAQASKVYEDATNGVIEDGTSVIFFGLGWVKTGPYALLLAGVVAMDGIIRGGPDVWEAMEPWMIGGLFLALLAIPARWLWVTRREVAPRKGVAMVLTPAEVLMRIPAGMLRARWKDMDRIGFDAKKKWSVLEGAHSLRYLVMSRKHQSPIRYEEPFIGVPVEVAQLILDAYRTGRLPQGLPEGLPRETVESGDEEE